MGGETTGAMANGARTPPGRFAATLPIEGREGASRATGLARSLRKALTGPEAKLWVHLKRIKTLDTHFRKQAPFGRYVLDFVCHRAKLVIEVDGDQHGWGRQSARDAIRDRFLAAEGYRILRFSNPEVLREIDAVLDTIYAALHGAKPPRSHSKRLVATEFLSFPSMGEVARRARGGDLNPESGEMV